MEHIFIGIGATVLALFLLAVAFTVGEREVINACDNYGEVQWQGDVYKCSKVMGDNEHGENDG